MKGGPMCLIVLLMLGAFDPAVAASLKDEVKVEVHSASLQSGMDPGMYVCAAGHLHIKGTVQNLASVPLDRVKVAGEVFGTDGKLLGTATSPTQPSVVEPGHKAEFNLEFVTVTGPKIRQVKKYEVKVVEVSQRASAPSPMNPCVGRAINPCAAKGSK